MRKIYYKPSAIRIIKKFKPTEREVFTLIKEEIRQTPDAGGYLSGKLTGLRKWKYRVGGIPYRVVYRGCRQIPFWLQIDTTVCKFPKAPPLNKPVRRRRF